MIRRALITGVAGGIGSATARILQEEGWEVAGTDLREPPDDLTLTAFSRADLGDPRSVIEVVNELAGDRLDALVNNAAHQPAGTVETTEVEAWDEAFAVNVRAAYVATRAALDRLRAARGAVVNVASVHAIATTAGRSAYVASKGALTAWTRSTALELAPDGIRVNAVLPGAIDTPMLRTGVAAGGGDIGDLARRTPLGRVGDPEEVARCIAFLADGSRASFVTGQSLVVDGGATVRLSTE